MPVMDPTSDPPANPAPVAATNPSHRRGLGYQLARIIVISGVTAGVFAAFARWGHPYGVGIGLGADGGLPVELYGALATLLVAIYAAVWTWPAHDSSSDTERRDLLQFCSGLLAVVSLLVSWYAIFSFGPDTLLILPTLSNAAIGLAIAVLALDAERRLADLFHDSDSTKQQARTTVGRTTADIWDRVDARRPVLARLIVYAVGIVIADLAMVPSVNLNPDLARPIAVLLVLAVQIVIALGVSVAGITSLVAAGRNAVAMTLTPILMCGIVALGLFALPIEADSTSRAAGSGLAVLLLVPAVLVGYEWFRGRRGALRRPVVRVLRSGQNAPAASPRGWRRWVRPLVDSCSARFRSVRVDLNPAPADPGSSAAGTD